MFHQSVLGAIGDHSRSYATAACPDQFVGLISDFIGSADDFPHRDLVDEVGETDDPTVVLILESPHKSEFLHPIGPAKGSTGRLIRRYIKDIISGSAPPQTRLFLMNAIQYQCSLGEPPEKYRDKVFRVAWANYARRDFIHRISALNRNNINLIVNACTKGKPTADQTPLRALVEDAISEALSRRSDIRICHPASWASPHNRRATW